MKEKKLIPSQLVLLCVFWGSLWGIAEATLGSILHGLKIPGLAGFVMFPLGLFFMVQAYMSSGRLSVFLYTAVVAACIKLTGLFFPTPAPFAVINPALAIVLESLVVVLLFPGRNRVRSQTWPLRFFFIAAFSWRAVYAVSVLGLCLFFPVQSFMDLGLKSALQFFFLESLANGFLLLLLFQIRLLSRNVFSGWTRWMAKNYYPLLLLVIAVFLEILV
ncbi:MAG: hypothetical protein PVF22_00340 [Candidatus Aminicenantes bacterium]|jgi:hypothetical protein